MRVSIPSVLQSYTGGARVVDAHGATLSALLAQLDVSFPGIRFRMVNEAHALRPHVRIFVNGAPVTGLDQPLLAADEVTNIQALSGG